MDDLRELLQDVRDGRLSVDDAVGRIDAWPYIQTDVANLDIHRRARRGLPEVIYCEAKQPAQVREIYLALADRGEPILGTRATAGHYDAVRDHLPDVAYDPVGRLLTWHPAETGPAQHESLDGITVVSAGSADEPVLREATGTLEAFGHNVRIVRDAGVAGLQRILNHVDDLRAAIVVIVIAGMDGALPSVVAGLVPSPVIAVPTSVGYGASFGGLAALLAMLNNCSSGVSVVNIDNGFGAAYAASLIVRKVKDGGASAGPKAC